MFMFLGIEPDTEGELPTCTVGEVPELKATPLEGIGRPTIVEMGMFGEAAPAGEALIWEPKRGDGAKSGDSYGDKAAEQRNNTLVRRRNSTTTNGLLRRAHSP